MKSHRVKAIVLRYLFLFRRSYDRLTDAFYWPTIDLLVWGLMSAYFQARNPGDTNFMVIIVTGILFWLIVWRGQYEITVNILEDLWNKNLVNIFVSPLSFWEWVTSFIIIGMIKAFLSVSFASLIAFLLYKISIFIYGFYLIPYIISLILTGWWIGFMVGGLILRFGTKIQTLAWAFVAVISPFSAIYYPVSVLPQWAQVVAWFIPTTYIFEGARAVINGGQFDFAPLLVSLFLNIIYLGLSLAFLRTSFDKILKKGLVKVY